MPVTYIVNPCLSHAASAPAGQPALGGGVTPVFYSCIDLHNASDYTARGQTEVNGTNGENTTNYDVCDSQVSGVLYRAYCPAPDSLGDYRTVNCTDLYGSSWTCADGRCIQGSAPTPSLTASAPVRAYRNPFIRHQSTGTP